MERNPFFVHSHPSTIAIFHNHNEYNLGNCLKDSLDGLMEGYREACKAFFCLKIF